ncbi:MAG TPA: chemotaxis protein CheB [Ktedonobacteraceae bacterium]|nr:chemotaxis protein CheB [Ktedonobacteraceae bacterium]
MSGHDIIVVGTSAGGVEALQALVRGLPGDIPAAIFVVVHIPAESRSWLPEILNRAGPLLASHPEDGTEIEYGHIYIAPPDQHLLVEKGIMRVVRGPKENRHRPAIDPLFRSAALVYGPQVVGVVLTGGLDDGTAGLLAIKMQGGIAVVQDPQEALYPSMPQSVLNQVQVDYCSPLTAIGPLLTRLAFETVENGRVRQVPLELEKEVRNAAMETNPLNNNEQVGKPSVFSCPECGGVLWELEDGSLLRFRCRIGHAFSSESVLAEQSEALEKSLWAALKTLDEKVNLSRRMTEQARKKGREWLARRFEDQLQEAEQHAVLLRTILTSSNPQNGIVDMPPKKPGA